jgi:hypothetical protein
MKLAVVKTFVMMLLILVGAWVTLRFRSTKFDLEPGSAVIIAIWGGFVTFLVERFPVWMKSGVNGYVASRLTGIAAVTIVVVGLAVDRFWSPVRCVVSFTTPKGEHLVTTLRKAPLQGEEAYIDEAIAMIRAADRKVK